MARVEAALEAAGLASTIERMPASTRTAEEAAAACGCAPGQIVKSLIFAGGGTGALKLLLVPGDRQADMDRAAALAGEALTRADPKIIRQITGFAIGGVAPIGHLTPIETWMDRTFLEHDVIWAAADAPNAVFPIAPPALAEIAGATLTDL